ncbi:MAG: endonuclease domain-containing protein [Sphingobacteriaceae bacterium]|nr:endonuclease domain-containing protein [Cytophagaceae bacterium]
MAQYPTNSPELEPFRKALRNFSTPAERALWHCLKNRQLQNRKFRRQFGIGDYILDFYCVEEKLAVELDGQPHFSAVGTQYDAERDAYLNRLGVRVLRFENGLVFKALEGILAEIETHFQQLRPIGRNEPRRPHDLKR